MEMIETRLKDNAAAPSWKEASLFANDGWLVCISLILLNVAMIRV